MFRAVGALSLVYGVACDFRQADLQSRVVRVAAVGVARASIETTLPKPIVRQASRLRELEGWMSVMNPMDPHVHRAMYQYWRASALMNADFWEESVTALDGVVAVGAEALRQWLGLVEQPSRPEASKILGMSKRDQDRVGETYQLRCAFGAHPTPTKWWDFTELYDEELGAYPEVVRRFLHRLFEREKESRIVEPNPQDWGGWFRQHAELLADTTWFARLPV
jgi:hypothetical protein